VPYIEEDSISHKTLTDALMRTYNMGTEKREEIGRRSRLHALKNYDLDTTISDWDRTLIELKNSWRSKHKSFEVSSF